MLLFCSCEYHSTTCAQGAFGAKQDATSVQGDSIHTHSERLRTRTVHVNRGVFTLHDVARVRSHARANVLSAGSRSHASRFNSTMRLSQHVAARQIGRLLAAAAEPLYAPRKQELALGLLLVFVCPLWLSLSGAHTVLLWLKCISEAETGQPLLAVSGSRSMPPASCWSSTHLFRLD